MWDEAEGAYAWVAPFCCVCGWVGGVWGWGVGAWGGGRCTASWGGKRSAQYELKVGDVPEGWAQKDLVQVSIRGAAARPPRLRFGDHGRGPWLAHGQGCPRARSTSEVPTAHYVRTGIKLDGLLVTEASTGGLQRARGPAGV